MVIRLINNWKWLPHLTCFIEGLQALENPGKLIVNKLIDTDKLFKSGSDYINIAVYNLNNTFWRDTIYAFQNIQDKMKTQTWKEFITRPEHNDWKQITFFFSEWFK